MLSRYGLLLAIHEGEFALRQLEEANIRFGSHSESAYALVDPDCGGAGAHANDVVDGKRATFRCPKAGESDVVLLGDIKAGDKGWQIEKAAINTTDKGFATTTEAVAIKAISVGPKP